MKYRKKPVEIDAIQLTDVLSALDFAAFMGEYQFEFDEYGVDIPTLEGTMHAGLGDWIIRGIKGEFYPIKNDIFIETYEKVEYSPEAFKTEFVSLG